MMHSHISKDGKLEITSYPYSIAIFCMAILFATVYATVFGNVDVFGSFVGVLLPVAFLMLLKRIDVVFDKEKVFIRERSFFTSKRYAINISDIENTSIVFGKGRYRHRGYVCIKVGDKNYPVTAMGGAQ